MNVSSVSLTLIRRRISTETWGILFNHLMIWIYKKYFFKFILKEICIFISLFYLSLFGRLAKKGSLERRSRWIQNNEKDKSSITSDEDEAEDYFTMQQNRELDDLKVDEVNNASSCCSDGEDGTSSINEN